MRPKKTNLSDRSITSHAEPTDEPAAEEPGGTSDAEGEPKQGRTSVDRIATRSGSHGTV